MKSSIQTAHALPRSRVERTTDGRLGEPRRIPALDGIRGLAILLVMLIHFTDRSPSTAGLANLVYVEIASAGWIGVDLFFVLSGFLITSLLLDAKTSPNYFRNFYARRTLRIFPLFYLCLFIWFVAVPVFHPPHNQYAQADYARLERDQIWYWSFLSNWKMGLDGKWSPLGTSVYWSLAIEEQFYLVWAAIVLLCSPRRLYHVCLALICGALVTRIVLVAIGAEPILIYVSTPTRIDTLAVGALVAAIARSPDDWVRARRMARWALPSAIVSLGVMWALIGSFSEYHPLMQTAGFTALGILCGSLVVLAISLPHDHWMPAAFSNRLLRFFGKYSYAMYLLHLTIASQLPLWRVRALVGQDGLMMQVALFFTSVTITLAVAWLSWHLLEKRFLALRSYFESPGSPPSAPTGLRIAN